MSVLVIASLSTGFTLVSSAYFDQLFLRFVVGGDV